ncbi:hypothetical protein BLOT_007249 [Blomia tropicalis]|nr:hypothetical protein BLOT_007249 [Blomia tropicalis]
MDVGEWRVKLEDNFYVWKECIQAVLATNDCLGAINQDYSLGDESHKKLDKIAYSILLQSLMDKDILMVMGSTSMYAAWNIIVSNYEKTSGARLHLKFKELLSLRIEFGKVEVGVTKFSMIVDEIEKMSSVKMSSVLKCHHLIAILPKELDTIINSYITMKPTDLKFNEVKDYVIAKDVQVNEKSKVFLSNDRNCAMVTHQRFHGKVRR